MASSAMHESAWDDPPSLLDVSELSSSVLDNAHASHVDEDDGEMELSSSLNLSVSSVSDSDDDRTPLFTKTHPRLPTAVDSPQLSHLTERQQLAYLMRTTQQQQHRRRNSSSSTTKQQLKRHAPSLPPPHPPHTKPKQQPPPATATTAIKQPNKPSLLTHDKKRRRTSTTATTSAIDPDDSHLYTVQRLPPATTAPAPLPQPSQYSQWSAEQRRRWDRVSEQPGLYYYHYTAPGVAVRAGEWDDDEVELLLHLLVCHPLAAGSVGKVGGASEWGLFSINVPGRVGVECERKWRELEAAGRLWSEDRFDYMRWYERQRLRVDERVKAEADTVTAPVAVEAPAGAALHGSTDASPPTVINRRRVGAPPPQPTADSVKCEAVTTIEPPTLHVEPAAVKQEAAAIEQPQPRANRQAKAELNAVADRRESVKARVERRDEQATKEEAREQPPRKKTVRFEKTPPAPTAPLVKAAPTSAASTVDFVKPALENASTATVEPIQRPPTAIANRRPPPVRVTIPVVSAAAVSSAGEHNRAALWPPRPPRMPIAGSLVPSTIRPLTTTSTAGRRVDTSQLTVNRHRRT